MTLVANWPTAGVFIAIIVAGLIVYLRNKDDK